METTRNGASITEEEQSEIRDANRSGRTPVVFVHGLWLLPSSWDRWAELFRGGGYTALTPEWPDDPETVEEARAKHEVFTGTPIGPSRLRRDSFPDNDCKIADVAVLN